MEMVLQVKIAVTTDADVSNHHKQMGKGSNHTLQINDSSITSLVNNDMVALTMSDRIRVLLSFSCGV